MNRYLYPLVRIALGLIFIAASYHKILSPDQFADGVYNYKILPAILVNLIAITLPYIELLFGLFLVFNFKTPSAALAVNLLMVVFLGAIFSAWVRGIDTGCGCFSNEGAPISLHEVARDLTFFAMAVYVFTVSIRRQRLKGAESAI